MPEFAHHALFPLADDATPYRLLSADHVGVERFRGGDMLTVSRQALGLLAERAFFDISHYLRPDHLAQLRAILDDAEASDNDRFVAYDLLKNANIAAGGCCRCARTPAPRSSWARRASASGPAAATRRPSPPASTRPTPSATCAIPTSRRFRCTRRSIPATTCRRRSRSTRPRARSTASCSSPRGAGRPTSPSCSRRRRQGSTRRACCASSTRRSAQSAPRPARPTTSPSASAACRPSST